MDLATEKRILVVDDEPDIRNYLATCIEDHGFQIETAKDGLEALAKIETFQPHLMTLDMVMPGMSGAKVIRQLRQSEKWAKLPIIVITAHAHDEFGEEDIKGFYATASGVPGKILMEKPISPPKLIAVICNILACEPAAPPAPFGSQTDKLKRLLDQADTATLSKITDLLQA